MKKIILILLPCLLLACSQEPSKKQVDESVKHTKSRESGYKSIPYSVVAVPWKERITDANPGKDLPGYKPSAPNRLGKHRAIISIPASGDAAYLNFEWRRHDKFADRKWFYIINKESDDTVRNFYVEEVNGEHCKIIFGPVKKGQYYFYYLPSYIHETDHPYAQGDPMSFNGNPPSPDEDWINRINIGGGDFSRFIQAQCTEIQSKTAFDSFYPMEVIATATEKDSLAGLNAGRKFLVFPEDRKYPIRMLDNIPQKWITGPVKNIYEGTASKNEYFTFQLGVWAIDSIADLQIEFRSLEGDDYALPVSAMTCFNTGGINAHGQPFIKILNLSEGQVQPMWIGLDLPGDIPAGSYHGKFFVSTANAGKTEIEIHLTVEEDFLADRGDSEPWRHSRLRWLNSTLGIDENPVDPYLPIELSDNKLILTDKEVTLIKDGLPGSIRVHGEELLAAPVQFTVETAGGPMQLKGVKSKVVKQTKNCYSTESTQRNKYLQMVTHAEVESDGWMKYIFTIKAMKDMDITDIRMTIPYTGKNSTYLSGMDLYDAYTPDYHEAKWDTLFDAFWIGSTKAGLYCELRGTSYSGPMLYWGAIRDFYKPKPPQSWYNNDNGGFRIRSNENQRDAIVCSGPRSLKKGDVLSFECAFIITPLRKLDTRYNLANRYYHNMFEPEPGDKINGLGIKTINLHHGNNFNKYINYPFISIDSMKDFVDRHHEKGMKVKIYYTTREITSMATEIWAFRSLGNEILTGGPGGGFSWLQEHFGDDYTFVWYIVYPEPYSADAAIQTSIGINRFYNYYIEDLRWLVKNVGIDGLYIDGAAYDRETVKRIKKAMAAEKPGCILDLHEGKHSILRYLEFFPYLDKIWFGEGVDYESSPPVDWLISISGIPFGLMGDMLHLGGNPWRGMVYGMTARYGWDSYGIKMDPTNIWRAIDEFGIADSKMIGYWEENPVVTTSDRNILATTYLKDKKMMISIGSWAKEKKDVRLNIDFSRTGINPDKVSFIAPAIKNFQPGKTFKVNQTFTVEPGRGWLIVVEEK